MGGSRRDSKILDLASQRAMVTGEWYIPGHKLRGFRVESVTEDAGVTSKGEAKVETTGMHLGEFDFIFRNLKVWMKEARRFLVFEDGESSREAGESFKGRPFP